jgi:transglutaminase/protease-like cytokinesis protein 3
MWIQRRGSSGRVSVNTVMNLWIPSELRISAPYEQQISNFPEIVHYVIREKVQTDITWRESFVIPQCWRSEGRLRSEEDWPKGRLAISSAKAQSHLHIIHKRINHHYLNLWPRQLLQRHDITRKFNTGKYRNVIRDTSIQPQGSVTLISDVIW